MSERVVIPDRPCEAIELGRVTGIGHNDAACPVCLGTGVALPASVTHPRRVEVGSEVEVLAAHSPDNLVKRPLGLVATVEACRTQTYASAAGGEFTQHRLSLTDYRRTPQ